MRARDYGCADLRVVRRNFQVPVPEIFAQRFDSDSASQDSPDSGDPDGREVPVDIPGEREDGVREEYTRVADDPVVCTREDRSDFLARLRIRQVSAAQ